MTKEFFKKAVAVATTAALLGLFSVPLVHAADVTLTTASTGTVIQNSNTDTTQAAQFLPVLGPTLTASTTGEASAYFGLHAVSATSTPGTVHWKITVDGSSSLSSGDVSVTQKGYFDQSGNAVSDTVYTPTVSGGNLVFSGPAIGPISSSSDFTSVDEISFASTTATGNYNISAELVDDTTGTTIGGPFSFSVDLQAPSLPDTTAPLAPVIAFTMQFASSSPITIFGTAEASSTITLTNGSTTATTTTSGSGQWGITTNLVPNVLNHLVFTATDAAGNTSSSTTLDLTYDTIAPVFGTTTDIIATSSADGQMVVNYTLPTATDNLSATTTVTCSPTSGSLFSSGTTTVNCTATDEAGNTATTSFSVIVNKSGDNGSSGNGGGSSSGGHRHPIPPGLLVAVQNANPNSAVAQVLAGFVTDTNLTNGRVLGIAVYQFIRALRTGDRGDDVVALQNLLRELGLYNGPTTGYYGPLTRNAVRTFQRNNGLPVTGVLDGTMMNILNNS